MSINYCSPHQGCWNVTPGNFIQDVIESYIPDERLLHF